jgi:plastocyanin
VHRRPRPAHLARLLITLALVAGCSAGTGAIASFAGATITIQARDLAFNPDIITAPAGVPLRLVLDNQDQGVSHDLRVFQGDTELGRAPAVVGPGISSIELPALAPGRYQFACTLHPDMIGTIILAPGASAGAGRDAEAGRQPPPAPPSSPGSVILAGSSRSSSRSGAMPFSRASSRMVRPVLKPSLAIAAAAS